MPKLAKTKQEERYKIAETAEKLNAEGYSLRDIARLVDRSPETVRQLVLWKRRLDKKRIRENLNNNQKVGSN